MSQIQELRRLIIGDNSDQLAELKSRIEDIERRTADVAEVLSPAIDSELKQGGDTLVRSLQKPVSLGLKKAIRSEPAEYAEILYPVMAPSIRRAIAQAISSMLVTINRTLESATTVQGLSLRLLSLRTGVPYGELALRRTLLYRVEHVFLIYSETGMAVRAVHAEGVESLDSDAVSAMFSAIQSFVQDSFSADESARLTDLKVGDHNVWVAHGPRVMLACVIWGDAPESLKSQLYDTLDAIRTNYANDIADFSGETDSFIDVEHYIEPLLQLQLREDQVADKNNIAWPARILAIALLALIIYACLQWFDHHSKLSTLEHFLSETPGVVVTEVSWLDDKFVVEGLQDPDANLPFDTLAAYGIDRHKIKLNMIPFRSLEQEMELQRFNAELDLPGSVYLTVKGGKVFMYGQAPLSWLIQHDTRLRQLNADRRLDIRELSVDPESVSELIAEHVGSAVMSEIRLADMKRENRMVIVVAGVVPASQFVLLQALFASNSWVDASALTKADAQ